ncbi:MAG: ABC transporter substrate-binding protein [Thermodesulfobacteriota bacterium]
MRFPLLSRILIILLLAILPAGRLAAAPGRVVTDADGRSITIAAEVSRVICSGPGCLRLLTYLQAEDLAVAVDDMETRTVRYLSRPYALANPQLAALPLFGRSRGQDNPELIVGLDPAPQLIFRTFADMGHDPRELEKKTGIPVVVLDYGDFGKKREAFYAALRTMAGCLNRTERAEAVIAFFEKHRAELVRRTAAIAPEERRSAYIGGVAFKGAHGFQATDPTYSPFTLINADNVAAAQPGTKEISHARVERETLITWNPDFLFVDLATMQVGEGSGLDELANDPAYQALDAVGRGAVYAVPPLNSYATNYDSLLASAYFIGKTIYPDSFRDIDPVDTADEIYAFLVGAPVFAAMDRSFSHTLFRRLPLPHVR